MRTRLSIRAGLFGALFFFTLGGHMQAAGNFDTELWKANRGNLSVDNPRKGMLGEAERLIRPGMTRAEVVALLGEPDTQRGNRAIYYFGQPVFGIDLSWFVVEFDENGKVRQHFVEQG